MEGVMFVEAVPATNKRSMGVLLLPTFVTLAVMASILAPGVVAHSYHIGSCPRVKPKTGFNIQMFLGRWYVIQKTSTRVRCLTNDFSWTKQPSRPEPMAKQRSKHNCVANCGITEWAEEVEAAQARGQVTLLQRMVMPVPGLNNGVRYTGSLKPNPDYDSAGAFLARFPLNMFGSSSYVVVDTDYDDFAVAVSCQRILGLWHRMSASIMSRKPFLEEFTIKTLRRLLMDSGINVDNLDTIRHPCDEDSYDKGIQVDIKPKVLQSNVTQLIQDSRDAASAVSQAVGRAYDVYHAVNGGAPAPLGPFARRRRKRLAPTPPSTPSEALLLLAQWMP